MFNSSFLEGVISLITLYLVFSQLTLSLVELPAGFLNTRGNYLYKHLETVLGTNGRAAFYAAPAIQSLMLPASEQGFLVRLLRVPRWPAYISETLFAQTIIAWVAGLAPPTVPPGPAITQFQAGLAVLPVSLQGLIQTLYATATATATTSPTSYEEQSKALQKNLEAWFHEYGERMSGWYKRDNRKWLFLAGLFVAVLADVDTGRLARFIFDGNNNSVRTALVTAAVQATQAAAPASLVYNPADPAEALRHKKRQTQLDSLLVEGYGDIQTTLATVPKAGLPLGWLRWMNTDVDTSRVLDPTTKKLVLKKPITYEWAPTADDYQMPVYAQRWTLNPQTGTGTGHPPRWSWRIPISGWLLTAFAMMLGAPFWFDTLCRFVNIRNVGIKPPPAK